MNPEPQWVNLCVIETGDAELNAIALCVAAVHHLDPSAKQRVVTYLQERFS